MEPVTTACVCTTLRMATRSVTRLYDHALSGTGLRTTGYALLARLADDGPLPISQLAARLALERTTCSRELEPLVRAGLVEIQVGEDRRQRVARLSEAGAEAVAGARPHWERAQQEVARSFGRGETGELLGRLRLLLRTVEDAPGRLHAAGPHLAE
jgi:DNA-binding MarR family transcriptional regulator